MKKSLRRLRLREGDIVVVKDQHTMDAVLDCVQEGKTKGLPNCRIIFAPNGVHRLSRDYLERLLKKTA